MSSFFDPKLPFSVLNVSTDSLEDYEEFMSLRSRLLISIEGILGVGSHSNSMSFSAYGLFYLKSMYYFRRLQCFWNKSSFSSELVFTK